MHYKRSALIIVVIFATGVIVGSMITMAINADGQTQAALIATKPANVVADLYFEVIEENTVNFTLATNDRGGSASPQLRLVESNPDLQYIRMIFSSGSTIGPYPERNEFQLSVDPLPPGTYNVSIEFDGGRIQDWDFVWEVIIPP